MKTFSMMCLGCSKNTSDSNRIMELMCKNGYEYVSRFKETPSIILVNTCAFTAEAREGTHQAIRSLLSQGGDCVRPKIVVLGCYVAYPNKADDTGKRDILTDVDATVPFADYLNLPKICDSLLEGCEAELGIQPADGQDKGAHYQKFLQIIPQRRMEKTHIAYLKIAEGCSLGCYFCSIPAIRGRQVSRPIEEIVEEARCLAEQGTVELNIIAQETTTYGYDLYHKPSLVRLLKALLVLSEIRWFRLNYCHPKYFSEDLIELIASEDRILPYFDIPLQHINDRILKDMGRNYRRKDVEGLLERIKTHVPESQIVTSFIVGYPGETDADFAELEEFVRTGWFRYVNCFEYSREKGTRAYDLPNQIPKNIKHLRAATIRQTQREIFHDITKQSIGTSIPVLIDSRNRHFRYRTTYPYIARSIWDAPSDSYLRIRSEHILRYGEIHNVRVIGSEGYVLFAEIQ
jgi:ribosomal protein S12 methylthiotransferase